jgi:hypothetical protein
MEHPGEEAAKEGEAGDPDRQGEQAEAGGQRDAVSQAGGHAPQLQIEVHGMIVSQLEAGVESGGDGLCIMGCRAG